MIDGDGARRFALACVLAGAMLTSAMTASAQTDLDCWQFASWDEAQATYESTVASTGYDWMRLDEDADGIACECLYYGYECWTPYQ